MDKYVLDEYSTNMDHYGDVWAAPRGEFIKPETIYTHLRLERSRAYFTENGRKSHVRVFISVADKEHFIKIYNSELDPFLPEFVILD